MGDVVASTPEPSIPPAKSFPARVAGVFLSPGEAFADIARKPDFIAPLILAIVAAVAVTESMLAKIGMERIIRTSIEQSGRASSMSPEQMEQAVHQGARIAGIFAHVFGVLGPPIYLAILAGIGLLIVNAIFGAHANFKTAFSVACYAYLPAILGGLMALAIILFGDPERFNAENPIPSNVGFFLNPLETSKPLYKFAASVDIFTLWLIILLGIGFSEAAGRKVKPRSVFLVFFGLWVLWILGKVAWAALMG
jgi:hypothetical protein